MQQYDNVITDLNGRVVKNATIRINNEDGSVATVYDENVRQNGYSGVLTTGRDGRFSFYAPNGRYTGAVLVSGRVFAEFEALLFDPADGGADFVKWNNLGTPMSIRQALDIWDAEGVDARNPRFAGGAKGDGIADDSAAIQAAIDYVSSFLHGGYIILGRGVFCIKNTLNIPVDKVGIIGRGAELYAVGFAKSARICNLYHSPQTDFPAFRTLKIEGLICRSQNRNGIFFSVGGNGLDRFAAQIHFKLLNIKDCHIAWEYRDYAFSIMQDECSVAGLNQVFKMSGTESTGANYVFNRLLMTTVGNKAEKIPAFDFGTTNNYKLVSCNLEACDYTVGTSSGSDVAIIGGHWELDVGKVGAPLFETTNVDYGHFVFDNIDQFWWQSTSDVPPLHSVGDRMSAFSSINCRIVNKKAIPPEVDFPLASASFLAKYGHPFIADQSITLRSPMQPGSGQALLFSAPKNNYFTNSEFKRAYTEDFVALGTGDPVQIVSDRPQGADAAIMALEIGRGRSVETAMFEVPDAAQVMMCAHWGETTFYSDGAMALEIRGYNANKQQVFFRSVSIVNAALNVWARFEIDALKTLTGKGIKFVKLTYVANPGLAYRLTRQFLDFA